MAWAANQGGTASKPRPFTGRGFFVLFSGKGGDHMDDGNDGDNDDNDNNNRNILKEALIHVCPCACFSGTLATR